MTSYNFEQLFVTYITQLVEITYGFTPQVSISMPDPTKVAIVLDGNEIERSMMMGRKASNFKAIKMLFRTFCRRHGYFSYLFIAPYNFENQYELREI